MKMENRTLQWLQFAALLVAVVAITLVGLAGPANKFGVLNWHTALTGVIWGAYVGVAAAGLALIALILRATQRKGVFWCVLALVLGGVAVYFPMQLKKQAQAVPPIHDITTDTRSPPQFVVLLAARGKDSNPVEYDPDVAEQQQKAYPDIEPLMLEETVDKAWPRALATAKAMGWQVAASELADGQIEATDTTAWFGFKDDIVIRVHQFDPGHTRIDVRSVSRVGKSDLGANAARIRKYLKAVQGA